MGSTFFFGVLVFNLWGGGGGGKGGGLWKNVLVFGN